MQTKRKNLGSRIMKGLIYGCAAFTMFIIVFLIGFILIKGLPHITGDLFSLTYTSENVSLVPALLNTFLVTALALLIAVPVSVAAAVYLTEYAKKNNVFVRIIRIAAETLSGIPSIVYGLFGMLFFVTTLRWRNSLMAGIMTLVIMIIPLIMRTAEEAMKGVPDMYREASFGLGAGKLRTIWKVVLPAAMPGILSGIILATGRIVGETAALLYTAGTATEMINSVMDSGRTLAVHMYSLSREGIYMNQAYATAVILLLLVLGMNGLAGFLAKKIGKGK